MLPEAVVTPVNIDSVTRTSNSCVAAVSDSTLPDEPPSLSSDEPSTDTASSGLPAYDSDVVTESAVVDVATPVSGSASFIMSSCYADVTQSYLPCATGHSEVDMVTTSDCLLQSVPDEDDEEMVSDEQIEDWDHEVFDP